MTTVCVFGGARSGHDPVFVAAAGELGRVLAARGDVLVFGGGVIPDADARALREQGVAEIFGPGSSLKAIGQWLETTLDESD